MSRASRVIQLLAYLLVLAGIVITSWCTNRYLARAVAPVREPGSKQSVCWRPSVHDRNYRLRQAKERCRGGEAVLGSPAKPEYLSPSVRWRPGGKPVTASACSKMVCRGWGLGPFPAAFPAKGGTVGPEAAEGTVVHGFSAATSTKGKMPTLA
ncbi:hypothetical protein GQ53DRAFT_330241 [Thozetella sp. PMI_491]|nr:hypothetical protein GQ53DRAFT_330241 [Thozetella sp. PMI_491]